MHVHHKILEKKEGTERDYEQVIFVVLSSSQA